MIWALAIAHVRPKRTLGDGSKIEKLKRRCLPGLLATSHQLRQESAPLFFSQNTFVIRSERRFDRLAQLLAISGNVWNRFFKCVVLITDDLGGCWEPYSESTEIILQRYCSQLARECQETAKLANGIVWTALWPVDEVRCLLKLEPGLERRYEVVGGRGGNDLAERVAAGYDCSSDIPKRDRS